jgi:DNA-binding Lrp family transcriptional regulator
MISKKDKIIFNQIRKNAKINLTDISKITGIPASTIYDRVKTNEKIIVKKHTTLLNFSKMRYHAKAKIAIKVSKIDKNKIQEYFTQHSNVNSLYKTNYDYDFLLELIYPNYLMIEKFINNLESKFDIKQKIIFNIIDDIKREEFQI